MLAAMKFKGFVWPNNPKALSVEYKRTLHSYILPFSGFTVQSTGVQHKVIKGEGEFAGPNAYETFRQLSLVFADNTAGFLELPVWGACKVYFAKLKLNQEPREEYVSYSFEFWECDSTQDMTGYTPSALDNTRSNYITAQTGDTISIIASRCNKSISQVRRLNPGIPENETIAAGRLIRIS